MKTSIIWCAALLLVLAALECAGVGYLGLWREGFWQAVETKNTTVFIYKLCQFTGIALLLCIISGYSQYMINYISLLIRTKLTHKGLKSNYQDIEGGAQRIQEDCFKYPLHGVTLLVGLFQNCINLITFSIIIGVQLGAIYLLVPVVYAIIGTSIAHYFAKPLMMINYMNQKLEACFRNTLMENLGSYIGHIRADYWDVYINNNKLFKVTKKLQYFQSFYNQITVIVPYIVIAPLYFGSQLLFGTFMQVASAMNHVIESLSYIINSYDTINKWLSCRKRLKELGII